MNHTPTIWTDTPPKPLGSKTSQIYLWEIADVSQKKFAFPEFQRLPNVWNGRRLPLLIDSILRGIKPPALSAYLEKNQIMIFDGQQRFWATRKFLTNQFPTLKSWHRGDVEEGLPLIFPNRFFSAVPRRQQRVDPVFGPRVLPQEWQDWLLKFAFTVEIYDQPADPRLLEVMYRRFQYGLPMKPGEILKSYETSYASEVVARLTESDLWTFYGGGRRRSELSTASAILLALELYRSPLPLSSRDLVPIVSGSADAAIDEYVIRNLERHVRATQRLFGNAYNDEGEIAAPHVLLRAFAEIIPIYQAVLLLDQAGYDLDQCEEGCLATAYPVWRQWASSVNARGIGRLTSASSQQDFWEFWTPRLFETEGLVKRPDGASGMTRRQLSPLVTTSAASESPEGAEETIEQVMGESLPTTRRQAPLLR